MATIAFDFDGTLTDIRIRMLAKKMKSEGNDIWIVTARKENEFNEGDMRKVLTEIMATKFNVIFCNGKPKIDVLKAINADIYIDNEKAELETINSYTNTIALLW